MELIINSCTEPYFNLAAEEYLLESKGDFFMLWRNDRSVIIGKNQNTFSQVNVPFAVDRGIKVVRRLTGGGAVFHDLGNINFTIITDAGDESIDFARFSGPIISALREMGVEAFLNGRNDICVGDCKISGNAQCVYNTKDKRSRLMHHGTLLFSADIGTMAPVLKVSKEKLRSKGVESVASRVCNIRDIKGYRGADEPFDFMMSLGKYAGKYGLPEDFDQGEKEKIQRLADEKYSKWQWNFGKSLAYSFSNSRRFEYGEVEISFDSLGGVINKAEISGDFFGVRDVKELSESLVGCRLEKGELMVALESCGKYIMGSTPAELAELIMNKQ